MIKVGITGNIGSGKTLVCRVFEQLGISVFYSDSRAKDCYSQEDVKDKIKRLFGEKVFTAQGEINLKKLSQIVFADTQTLHALNAIIHPLVLEEYEEWIAVLQNESYTLFESALLYPCKLTHFFDKIIFVDAPQDLQIKRVIQRDKTSLELVKQRVERQSFAKDNLFNPDYIILNNEQHLIVPQIMEIHNLMRNG